VDVFRELELEPIVDPVVEYVVLVKGRLGGEHLH
jgi:hypothetical protein